MHVQVGVMPRNARTAIGNKDLRLGSRQIARHLLLTRGLIPTVLKERHAFTFNSRLDAAKVTPQPSLSPYLRPHLLAVVKHGTHVPSSARERTGKVGCRLQARFSNSSQPVFRTCSSFP